jgi:hypothetical protein
MKASKSASVWMGKVGAAKQTWPNRFAVCFWGSDQSESETRTYQDGQDLLEKDLFEEVDAVSGIRSGLARVKFHTKPEGRLTSNE